MRFLSILILTVVLSPVIAQVNTRYDLFHPVPKSEMRDFQTDRPSETESPFTVDAGHFQLEADVVRWNKFSRSSPTGTLQMLNGLYKLGLFDRVDLQLGFDFLNAQRNYNKEFTSPRYGATTIRLKYNVQGNNGEKKLAFALLPFVVVDSHQSEIDYAFEMPFSYELTDRFDLSWQPQIQLAVSEGASVFSYEQTISIGGNVVGHLDFFAEAVGNFTEDQNNYFLNGGFTYDFLENLRGDIATHQTVNRDGPSFSYLGISFRL